MMHRTSYAVGAAIAMAAGFAMPVTAGVQDAAAA